MRKKRIMVDMSCTLIHHGHIRLIKKASKLGSVIVGLTEDKEILSKKGFQPELSFDHRKEILEALTDVSEVVSTPWLINQSVLDNYKIDILVHGKDNTNNIQRKKLKIFPRTKGISSSILRDKSLKSLTQKNNSKLMLTPGPATILHENLINMKPVFGRGDKEYTIMSNEVNDWVLKLSGQDEIVCAQGSATFGLELALHSFVKGRILLISTGYYSDRLEKLLPNFCDIKICKYEELDRVIGKFDWVLCAYTETSVAFKVDIELIRNKADNLNSKLFLDATGSIGLEENHNLADLMAFSSCKGLFGLTGACFIAYKSSLKIKKSIGFYTNIKTHQNKMVTGPYHAISSLYGVINNHYKLKRRVIKSKNYILKKFKGIVREDNQPLLCTYLKAKVIANDKNVVLYSPRSKFSGSVICHLGEIHSNLINIGNRIRVLN